MRAAQTSLSDAGGLLVRLSGSHDGAPPPPFWRAWPEEPILLIGLALTGSLYVLGWRRLVRRTARQVIPPGRVSCFGGGMLALFLSLLSPIAVYSESLFFMHMVQHLLLLLIAPPLLWLGAPLLPTLWGLPTPWRRAVGRQLRPGTVWSTLGHVLTHPGAAAALYVSTVALWHIPALYDAAQGRTVTHDFEHIMFFGTALLFWWPIIHPSGGRRRLSYARAIPYLLPPFLEGMLIGALITFAGSPVYTTYQDVPRVWGFSVVDDQQLGGLIMWVPGGMLFLIPLIGLLAALFRQEEASAQPLSSLRDGSRP